MDALKGWECRNEHRLGAVAPLVLRTTLGARSEWRFLMAADGGFASVGLARFLVLAVEE